MPGMLLAISFWEPEATKSECCFEESDFEISLFPVQCYGNFEKSKKIIQTGKPFKRIENNTFRGRTAILIIL